MTQSTATMSKSTTHDSVRQEKTMRKAAITGVAVICEMLTGGIFLENLKMEKQRTSEPYPRVAARVMRQGLGGFWAGFWPWGFTLGMTKGAVLGGARAFFLNRFLNNGMDQFSADLCSGFLAGGTQGIVMGPILLARTRVNQHLIERAAESVDGKIANTSLLQEMRLSMSILNNDIRAYGIKTLFIGMPTMVIKRSLDWGSRFFLMRMTRDAWTKYKPSGPDTPLTDIERLMCTFIGSGSSCFILQPLDRAMPIIQAARSDPNETPIKVLKQRVKIDGLWNTLQRGVIIRLIHVGWHTSWAIFASHKIYDWLDKKI
eukprot:387488_1